MPDILELARLALRQKTTAFDEEIILLIEAAKADLSAVGVAPVDIDRPLIARAVITYVKAHFGSLQAEEYDRLNAAYNSQKGQLLQTSGYTDWGTENG